MISKLSLKSGMVRNVLTLFTGSTIAQAIPVLISPILTRIFPVEEFATLTVVTTLITLLGGIICGRYEIAIGLPADEKEARQLVYLSITVAVFMAIISTILILFLNKPLARLLNNENAAPYLLLVPITALIYGINQALTFWNIRKRNYALMSSSRVTQSIANSGTSLAAGFSSWSFNGLVTGNIVGNAAALLYTYFSTKRKNEISLSVKEFNNSEMKLLAKKYSDLPMVNGVHALTDNLQSTGVVFVISALFGSVALGLYGNTMRILQAPVTMIGSSFSIVFYKEASEKVAAKLKITKLLRTTIITLALIAFPVFLTIMLTGPSLFAFVFGETWRQSGVYAAILSPALFMNFISSPVSHLPVILNRQRQFFMLSLIGNVLILLSITAGSFLFHEIKNGLILMSVTQVLFYGFLLCYFYSISKKVHG